MAHLIELDMVDELSKLVLDIMMLSKPPEVPERYVSISSMQTLYANLNSLREILNATANGDLTKEVAIKGYMGDALRTLQTNLKAVSKQTRKVASGDLAQRIGFMEEFSKSFNAIVIQLDQALKEITNKDIELNQINEELVKGIASRKKAEAALSRVNENLTKEISIRKEAEATLSKDNGTLAREIAARKEAEAALGRVNKDLAKEIVLRKEAEAALRHSQESFRVLSITDPLTGLYNRRQFNHLAEVEIRRTLRYGRPLAAMMLDIDFFRHFNDTFGHTCGDMVLKLVAKTIKEMLRSNDIPARYGGEEFVVLFPETPVEAARNIAERLRRRIKESTTETERGPITVTASFGVCEFHGKTTTKPGGKILADFISKADQALNASKNAGRNRVTVYKPVED